MKITLKEYTLNKDPIEGHGLIGGLMEMMVTYYKTFNVEIIGTALHSNNQHVRELAKSLYSKYFNGMVEDQLPALKLQLMAEGRSLFLVFGQDRFMFPSTPADVLLIWYEDLYLDMEEITYVIQEQQRIVMREMHEEIDAKVAQFNERATHQYKEGDLVILPNGIQGTQMTTPLYAKVSQVAPPGVEWTFDRDADKYNLRLTSLDQSGRLFNLYSHSGRVIPAG